MAERKDILKTYEDLVDKLTTLRDGRQVLVDRALLAIAKELNDIDFIINEVEAELEIATDEVKAKVLELEETCEGEKFMAMYVKGAERWDTSKLKGYAIAHPELLELRSYGEPSVRFKKVSRKKE